jgi:hypothetical protein
MFKQINCVLCGLNNKKIVALTDILSYLIYLLKHCVATAVKSHMHYKPQRGTNIPFNSFYESVISDYRIIS